jgi:hypothetical protein
LCELLMFPKSKGRGVEHKEVCIQGENAIPSISINEGDLMRVAPMQVLSERNLGGICVEPKAPATWFNSQVIKRSAVFAFAIGKRVLRDHHRAGACRKGHRL